MSLRAKNELFYTMTTMFIDNIIKKYDLQEMTKETKVNYLRNIVQYCERHYDQTYEGNHPKAQHGWLVLKDQKGEKHDVAYRGIWSIEKLKELMALQFSVKPEDLHLMMVHDICPEGHQHRRAKAAEGKPLPDDDSFTSVL